MLAWLVGFALAGPLLGIAAVVADRFSGGRPLSAPRFLVAGAIGGAVGFAPAGLIIGVATEHGGALLTAPPLALIAGSVVGAMVGGLVVLILRRIGYRFTS